MDRRIGVPRDYGEFFLVYHLEQSMRSTDNVRTITGNIVRESDKAILIRIQSIGERPLKAERNEWFPFSQVSKIHRNPNQADQDYLIASEWILETKGLLKKEMYKQPADMATDEVSKEQSYDPVDDLPAF